MWFDFIGMIHVYQYPGLKECFDIDLMQEDKILDFVFIF